MDEGSGYLGAGVSELLNGSTNGAGDHDGSLPGVLPEAAHSHLSQGDLEALASIQEELDRFGSASSQTSFVEGIVNPITTSSTVTNPSNPVTVTSGNSVDSGQAPVRQTVRVVKRPASSVGGPVVSKVRIGEGGQQYRIVNTAAPGSIVSMGGQTLKIIGSSVGGNLKTIVPSDGSNVVSQGGSISIVNKDGSITTLPVGQQVKFSSTTAAGAKPQIRILPNQQQTIKILNPDGSFSDVVTSLRPSNSSDVKTSAVESSPRKKITTFTVKSPQKIQLKSSVGDGTVTGPVFKTSDGRIITLQGSNKKVILPASSSSSGVASITSVGSPTKIIIKPDQSQTRVVNGQSDPVQQQSKPGQLIRLTQEIATSLTQSASDNKVQFVRVVGGGGGLQTVQLKQGQQPFNTVQGIKSVVPGTVKMEEEEVEVKPDIKPQFFDAIDKSQKAGVTPIEPSGVRPRKPCNCTKSQCLKLYCDCFANGEFCFNCNCNNCLNNLDHEDERQRSIKQCLDRNPNAFKPKIGKNTVEGERRHNKGCNCKRSGCLKNYCECYEAKIACTVNCKCLGCKNVDSETGAKIICSPLKLGHNTTADLSSLTSKTVIEADKWFKPSSSLKSKLLQAPLDVNEKGGFKQPFSCVTQEVVDATCQCLLAQAEEGEKNCNVETETEKKVLEEFGRCLAQIIEFSGKNKRSSSLLSS